MEKPQSTGVGGGDESGQIANHAAADGRDDGFPIGAQIKKTLPQGGGYVERLAFFAGLNRDHIRFDVLVAQAFRHAHGVGFLHVVISNQDDVRNFGTIRQKPARLGNIAGTDLDIVASLGQVDVDGLR